MSGASIWGCDLAIARRFDATLVTLDQRLETAARELGVAVERPKAS